MIVDTKSDDKFPLAPQVTQVFVTRTPDQHITSLSGQFQDHMHIGDGGAPPAYEAPPVQSNGSRSQEQQSFPPVVLHSRSQRLADGFFAQVPPTDQQPHPFITRHVQEVDWMKCVTFSCLSMIRLLTSYDCFRFLSDIRDTARQETVTSNGGTHDSRNSMNTLSDPSELIDRWNSVRMFVCSLIESTDSKYLQTYFKPAWT